VYLRPLDRPPPLGRLPTSPEVIVTGAYAGHGVALSVQVGHLIAATITNGRPLPPWGAVA
jgi:glycine/D-amino acid oxidase-like deaminating enzyme